MKFALAIVSGLLAVLGTEGAMAQVEPTPSPKCEQTARAQGELTECARKEEAAADKRLNAAYRDLMRYVDGEEKAKLVAAEKAWLAFRDADCGFFGHGDGSMAPMNEAFCRADLSRTRAKELEDWPPNAPRSALVPMR